MFDVCFNPSILGDVELNKWYTKTFTTAVVKSWEDDDFLVFFIVQEGIFSEIRISL